ncbi:hypothetical protein A2994_01540 [candidate division Kazan bacterium RIFCSPLOWO2_01_FULL_48_13]|uniref:EF-hand domain-containing protein n=1 Tax=candidate division Kazan bacterium RIFCSPLOWO2_01_FULL_48_13 TaxID=1798539 RepID=A0A1F4PPB9_UNCK3|nr:MAG: hypothetical protein A2994_01540 [candidate division Kazan bacterium RIFCSPLOWO2_01_FULL_48_13]
MENYNFDLGLTPAPARRKSRWLKFTAIATSIVVVAGLLVYSGGMEYMLKLLGVGASGIYEISVSNNRQLLGDAEFFVDGTQPELVGVTVFDQFSGTPADIDQSATGKGFGAAIFSSPANPELESYTDHYYVSAPIDLTLDRPLLSAVEVTDFNSADSTISYAYRSSANAAAIQLAPWQPLDVSVLNSATEEGIKTHAAIVETNIERFAQIKFIFDRVDPMQRAAVYSVSFQYKAEEAIGGGMVGEDAVEREISLIYQSVNAPANVDVDILSSASDNRVVYTEKQIDLSERISYTFATALTPGAYAAVISGPTLETQIIPFVVSALDKQIEVELGSFAYPTGQASGYDLNGDGVVNTLDLTILMGQFTQ